MSMGGAGAISDGTRRQAAEATGSPLERSAGSPAFVTLPGSSSPSQAPSATLRLAALDGKSSLKS